MFQELPTFSIIMHYHYPPPPPRWWTGCPPLPSRRLTVRWCTWAPSPWAWRSSPPRARRWTSSCPGRGGSSPSTRCPSSSRPSLRATGSSPPALKRPATENTLKNILTPCIFHYQAIYIKLFKDYFFNDLKLSNYIIYNYNKLYSFSFQIIKFESLKSLKKNPRRVWYKYPVNTLHQPVNEEFFCWNHFLKAVFVSSLNLPNSH